MERIRSKEIQQFEREHIEAVRALSPECMVLLRNDGVLPFDRAGKIALYGSGARNTIKGGTGSGDVNVRHFVNVEEGLENAGFEITTKAWLDAYDAVLDNAKRAFARDLKARAESSGMPLFLFLMGKVVPEPEYDLALEGEGDTAVYVLSRNSGEGTDRKDAPGDIRLTETEIRDIRLLNEKYERFVLVLNVGGMVDLAPVRDCKAVLLMSQLGSATGDALADVLLGKAYPSGKLTMTWADIEDYPSTEGFGDPDDTLYGEGIYVGYRYFDRAGKEPVYPFGYGLGYTTFSIEPKGMEADAQTVTVTVLVKNTGKAPGKEVVQLYYSAPGNRLDHPYQELAAYAKTRELAPGEEQEISIAFRTASMASFDEESAAWVLEKGTYYIRVGNSSRSTHIAGALALDGDAVTERVTRICEGCAVEEKRPREEPVPYEGEADEMAGAHVISIKAAEIQCAEHDQPGKPSEESWNLRWDGPISWEEVRKGKKTTAEFVASLPEEELACLCIGAYKKAGESGGTGVIGNAGMLVAGAAGETTHGLDHMGMEGLIMADGPAGLRLSTCYTLDGDGMAKAAAAPFSTGLEAYIEIPEAKMLKEAMKKQIQDAGEEVYHQYATAIPVGTAIAQSWSEELCRACGHIVGREMELFGVNLWLAPGLNIQRSPLCGRNFEYYSEDPVVSGNTAAAITASVQEHAGCGATIKHYMCNNQETNRFFSNSVVNERAIREIYLKGFEICVKKARPLALMTSYNLLNGEHTCNSRALLDQVLRREWGFEGIVMSDWRVTGSMRKNAGKYSSASAAGCVKAGNDIVMPGGEEDRQDILAALRSLAHPYALTREELLTCAKRVCDMVRRLRSDADGFPADCRC